MSNIDFSQMITRKAKAAHVALAHAQAVKAERRRRILLQISSSTQQNIVQAAVLYAISAQGDDTADAPPLSKEDIKTITRMHSWIARTQDICRILCDNPDADLYAKDAWPALPQDVKELVKRF